MAYINHITQNSLVDNGIVGTDYLISGASELLTASVTYSTPSNNSVNAIVSINFPSSYNLETNVIYNVLFPEISYTVSGANNYVDINNIYIKINNTNYDLVTYINDKQLYTKFKSYKLYMRGSSKTILMNNNIIKLYFNGSKFIINENCLLVNLIMGQYYSGSNDRNHDIKIYANQKIIIDSTYILSNALSSQNASLKFPIIFDNIDKNKFNLFVSLRTDGDFTTNATLNYVTNLQNDGYNIKFTSTENVYVSSHVNYINHTYI